MSLSKYSEINAYYLDSEFGHRTVTHRNLGPTGTGCRGTWATHLKLEGEGGATSVVEVQDLLPEVTDLKPLKGAGQSAPAISRAVKRIQTKSRWPEVDHWPMIERGLLCLARANVSDTIAVVRMLGWYQDTEHHRTYIAMEYYPHGNLRDWLVDSPPPDESWARVVIRQVLSVLTELEGAGLAHRNIKPSNILIASVLPIRIKLGDFYNAKWAEEDDGLHTQVGTLPYVAPEMRRRSANDDAYTAKIDMWAIGIILHEILTGAHPFCQPGRHRFSELAYDSFLSSTAPVVVAPSMTSANGVQFVKALLERDPANRPSAMQALTAPWFVQSIGQM